MKNLRIFSSMAEFEANKPNLDTPFVVLEKGTNKIVYTNLPSISEDDITAGQYIDLGLPSGTKWASCNLGATKPCEYGDYYAWGETTPKEVYSYSTYKYGTSSTSLTKYNNTDNKTVLEPEDDAVYVATNGAAHIPTDAQITELKNGTTSQWCQCTVLGDDHTEHNIVGRLFTGSNGNTIFIPASGVQDGSDLHNRGDYFGVWSTSLYESDANGAWTLDSFSDCAAKDACYRYYGLSVRGCKD